MPSIGHLAVGLAGARVVRPATLAKRAIWLVVLVAVSYAPDLDVLAFGMGIPYGATFGHRGAAHSLLVGVVLGVAAGWSAAAWASEGRPRSRQRSQWR